MRKFLPPLALLFLLAGYSVPIMTTSAYTAAVPQLVSQQQPHMNGVNGNPWGYTFVVALNHVIRNPPVAFCGKYFKCIANFWQGKGYVVECHDGLYAKSGGIRGSCSSHKGNWRLLYWH